MSPVRRRQWRTRSKLWPGEPGTKTWLQIYGDPLVCVRYLYDAERRRRYTTVELIVDERPWVPRPRKQGASVGVEVRWGEARLAAQIKAAGGIWDPALKVWRLPYAKALALNLTNRLVPLPIPSTPRRPPGGPRVD